MATHAHPVGVRRARFDPWHVAVVVLAAVVVGLGAWVVVDKTTGGGGTVTASDATALIDNFNAAAMANDGAKAMTMMTPNAVLWSNGDVTTGAKAWAGAIDTTPSLVVERVAPVTVEGNYALTFANYGVPGLGYQVVKSVFIYQLRDGKIAKLWTFVPGEAGSAPLDKVQPPA
ncbi:MAG TPA: nuclear transport factor 2 family protein [Gaiellaceae bacterium]|jgi:hypothetical protein|nr:nuclear transport factor 2 family protein [Gaiellaceae bacterium]